MAEKGQGSMGTPFYTAFQERYRCFTEEVSGSCSFLNSCTCSISSVGMLWALPAGGEGGKLRQGGLSGRPHLGKVRGRMGNHRDPKQEPRKQQREKLQIPELQQLGLCEEGQSWVPDAWLLLGGRQEPLPSPPQFLQVPSVVLESLVSLCCYSMGQNTSFHWLRICTRLMQTASVGVGFPIPAQNNVE